MSFSGLTFADFPAWAQASILAIANMTSSDWAAWVQAIGTIVAVIAAIFIASHQHRADRQRQIDADNRNRDQVAKLCVVYSHQALIAVAELMRGCTLQNLELISRQASRLEDIVHFGHSIDVSAIPTDAVITFMELRSLTTEALHDAKYVGSVGVSWSHWTNRFDDIRSKISGFNTDLHATIGDSMADAEKSALT